MHADLLIGRQPKVGKHAQPRATQPASDLTPPHFTPEDIKLYQRRLEEGYDVPDPRYRQWLESIGSNPETANDPIRQPLTNDPTPAESVCQSGKCGHPKARKWIGCDHCARWYHCLCAGISHKQAPTITYKCLSCS